MPRETNGILRAINCIYFFNAPNSSRMVLNGSYSFFKKKNR